MKEITSFRNLSGSFFVQGTTVFFRDSHLAINCIESSKIIWQNKEIQMKGYLNYFSTKEGITLTSGVCSFDLDTTNGALVKRKDAHTLCVNGSLRLLIYPSRPNEICCEDIGSFKWVIDLGFDNYNLFQKNEHFIVLNNLKKHNVDVYDIESGNFFFSINIKVLGIYNSNELENCFFHNNIQFSNDKIICPISGNKLIAIDINSGNLLWVQNDVTPFVKIHKEHIVEINSNWYNEYEVATGKKIKSVDLNEIKIDNNLTDDVFLSGTNGRFCVSDEFVYVPSQFSGTNVLVINRQLNKAEQVFSYDSEKGGVFTDPVVNDKYFYLLDGSNTLHIFQL